MNDYIFLNTDEGAYAISPMLVQRIAYQAGYFQAKLNSARPIDSQDDWGLPKTYHYEFDYTKAKAAGHSAAINVMMTRVFSMILAAGANEAEGVCRRLGPEVRQLKHDLAVMERSARDNRMGILKLLKTASADSLQSINSTVTKWQIAHTVATITRDVSADVFVVAAGCLSGGTAWAALGAGSVAKGVFKYQDTENAAAAVFTATTSFVTALIPVPAKEAVGKAQYYAVVIAKAKFEAATGFASGLIEGKSVVESAVETGATMATGLTLGPLVKHLKVEDLGAVKSFIGDTTIPVGIRVKLDVVPREVAMVVGASSISGLAGAGSSAGSSWLVRRVRQALSTPNAAAARIPLGDPVLADYAVTGPDSCTPARHC